MPNTPVTAPTIRFGTFELDVPAGELRKRGIRVKLQEQPFQILRMLLANPGKVVTREDLRSRLWPSNTYIDFDHGLNKAINKLREALGDSADSPRFIETLAKRGYRFLGDLKAEPQQIDSLLVLPLENLSRDPQQEYFADGLTEALITQLAKISALRVVSRTTAMYYKGAHRPLPEIARELSVDGVVEGTVLRSAERVRVSAQLVHAPSDTHLWAESYDGDLRDVMVLQAEVAQAIARQVEAKVTPHEQAVLARTRRVDPDVYEDYLKGRYHWNKRTPEGMSRSTEYFQRAIDKDPRYAPAYAGLADSASRLGFWGYVTPRDGCGRAKAAAKKGLEIDNSLGEAHGALSFGLLHYDYEFLEAEREGRLAIALDPRSAPAAQALACALIASGKFEEGVAEGLRAAQLDPLSLAIQWSAGAFLYHARQYDRAIAQSRRCLELDPLFPPPRWTIAMCLAKQLTGGYGIQELEEIIGAVGFNQIILGGLGYCYGRAGRREDALRIVHQLRAPSSNPPYVSAYWPAMIHGALGEVDEAFRLLDIAYEERAPWMAYNKVMSILDDLRSDPRLGALHRRMKIPEN